MPEEKPNEPTIAEQAKKVDAQVESAEQPAAAAKAEEAVQTKPDQAQQHEEEEHTGGGQRSTGVATAVGIAVLISVVLVAFGILAYLNSDTTTEVDELPVDTNAVEEQIEVPADQGVQLESEEDATLDTEASGQELPTDENAPAADDEFIDPLEEVVE